MYIPTPYEDLLLDITTRGAFKGDRTGTGTKSLFGTQLRYDLSQGFPLITTKKVHWKSILVELLWFLRAEPNLNYLHQYGVTIWDEWADSDGMLGQHYGIQWRSWHTVEGKFIDQLQEAIDTIRTNPNSRRILVSAWNPGELEDVGLPPCHILFQFYVVDGKLSLHVYQRSADMFLGVPFNIASYAALTHMVAKITNLKVGDLIWSGGDTHIYSNHFQQVEEQLDRDARVPPMLVIHGDQKEIDDFEYDDFEILGYDPHPAIKGDVAV